MHPGNGLHQVGCRVVTKVRADVADAQASTTGLQILWMLIGRFVQSINLQNKQQATNVTPAREAICSLTHTLWQRLT